MIPLDIIGWNKFVWLKTALQTIKAKGTRWMNMIFAWVTRTFKFLCVFIQFQNYFSLATRIFCTKISRIKFNKWRNFWVVYRLFSDELLYSEMRLSYLSISFGIGIYFIIWFEKCFEMETKHLLVEPFSWLRNPKNIFWGFFWLAGKILRLSIVWTVEDDP